jgi:hypothetical protein
MKNKVIVLLLTFSLTGCTSGRQKACRHEALIRSVENFNSEKYPDTNERAVLQSEAEAKYYNDCMIMSK